MLTKWEPPSHRHTEVITSLSGRTRMHLSTEISADREKVALLRRQLEFAEYRDSLELQRMSATRYLLDHPDDAEGQALAIYTLALFSGGSCSTK